MKKHVKIDSNYFLTTQVIESKVTVDVAKNVNHILIADVSGSMSWELEHIRQQLKNKLSTLMRDGDTITIIWFSGRNDCGILKEEVEVKSLKTLSDLHAAIDKWLRPVGLTAFLKPLELTKQVIERIKKNRPDSIFSLFFFTDGYNNDVPWGDVIKAVKALEGDLAASTFVEYGYYADSAKLTQMAGILGGEKISASSFDEYDPIFAKKISSPLMGGKKTVVDITDPYLYDFAFSVSDDGSVILYNIEGGKVMVGGDVKEVHFFSPVALGAEHTPETALYAAIYVLADKLLNDDAEKIFYVLGDNYYYQELLKSFGKQKLNAFKSAIKECVTDVAKRFPSGKGAIQKVPDDAYCLMNLIEDLGNYNDCLFYPNHADFVYNRVGRKRVAVGDNLTDDQKAQLANAKDMEELKKLTEQFSATNVKTKFVDNDRNAGYRLTDLVWNEERANLSVRIKIDGVVELPDNSYGLKSVPNYRYNTYTLIKDGIVNVAKLPVTYIPELYQKFVANGVKVTLQPNEPNGGFMIIDLNSVPIINKAMVQAISANALALQEWELTKLQGEKKVYDYYRKLLFPKESKSYIDLYGQEAADWLKTIGVTDYNGYNPPSVAEESTDFYMSVNLITKLKGVSSLPKVEDVVNKLAKGSKDSLKLSEWVMADAILDYQKQLETPMYKAMSEDQQKTALKQYLEAKTNDLNRRKRAVMQQIAEIKFSLILSKKWFNEFKSFDENKLDITADGQTLNFTFDLVEKEVKI